METTYAIIALRVIYFIAFAVITFSMIKLVPIMWKVIQAKRAKAPEVLIQGQTWKVNYTLLALTILPFIVYAGMVSHFAWIVYKIIGLLMA